MTEVKDFTFSVCGKNWCFSNGDDVTLNSSQLNMQIKSGSSHDNDKAEVSRVIIVIADVMYGP